MKAKTAHKLKIRARRRKIREDHQAWVLDGLRALRDREREIFHRRLEAHNKAVEGHTWKFIGNCLCRGNDLDCAMADHLWRKV